MSISKQTFDKIDRYVDGRTKQMFDKCVADKQCEQSSLQHDNYMKLGIGFLVVVAVFVGAFIWLHWETTCQFDFWIKLIASLLLVILIIFILKESAFLKCSHI